MEFTRPKSKSHGFFTKSIVKYTLSTHETGGTGMRFDFADLVWREWPEIKKRIQQNVFCEQLELQKSKLQSQQIKMLQINTETYPELRALIENCFATISSELLNLAQFHKEITLKTSDFIDYETKTNHFKKQCY